MAQERRVFRYDFILLAVIVLLTLLGLVTLFSASYLFAVNQPGRFSNIWNIPIGWTPMLMNFAVCIFMLILFPLIARKDLSFLKSGRFIFFLLLLTIGLNVLPFFHVFMANPRAMRWIRIGPFSFQPSEMIKVVLPLYLAYILEKNNTKITTFTRGPLPPALVTMLFCTLVLFQNNFSDAAIIAVSSLIICFISGIRLGWFLVAILVSCITAIILIFGDREGRWYTRIANFGRQHHDPLDTGYQITLSLDAIRSGGFWGKGIGQGTLKTRMPEVHGDFVFASFTEESGFLGVLLYFILIGIFAFICYFVVWKNKNLHSQILIFGLVTPIVVQTMLNIAVVASMIPTTGVALPFVSSGGSSLLMTLISAALLFNLTRRHVLHDELENNYAR